MRKLFVLNIFLVLIVLFACSDPETPVSAVDAGEFPSLTGPYLGQEPPGQEPELFAPGLVSTGAQELSICFSPAGAPHGLWRGRADLWCTGKRPAGYLLGEHGSHRGVFAAVDATVRTIALGHVDRL